MTTNQLNRNAPCHCGSGKRYKHCHGAIGQERPSGESMPADAALDADTLNAHAVQEAQRGALQEAIGLFEQARSLAPASAEIAINLSTALFQAGRMQDALAGIDRALATDPRNVQAMHLRGCALARLDRHLEALDQFDALIQLAGADPALMINRGNCLSLLDRADEALACFDRAINEDADNCAALVGRSDALNRLGRHAEALASAGEALAIDPDLAEALFNQGNALLALGRTNDALASYKRAAALAPDYAEAHYNCGNALLAAGRIDEALASYDRALAINPGYAQAHYNRANALREQGRLADAVACYDRLLGLKPDLAQAHNNKGTVLSELGRLDEAVACFRAALALKPDYFEALANLGAALADQGNCEEAIASCRKALAIAPLYAPAHYNLGHALKSQGELEAALASYRSALALKPDDVEAHFNVGYALIGLGRVSEAIESFGQALSLRPDYAEAHSSLGVAQLAFGKPGDALASFKQALHYKPDAIRAYSNLLYLHAFVRDISPEAERDLAAGWEKSALDESERAAAAARRSSLRHARRGREGRKLRLGVVSAELGQHAVAEFLEPFLERRDRSRFDLTLYPTSARTGARADRIAALADRVISLVGMSDADAVARIRADEIDVLVDTTAHMTGCRLGIFARRAAPVQCHYIGYHGSTGLSEMDWFIADDSLLPPSCDVHFREKIWRLPRLWIAYRGDSTLPESQWKPHPEGVVTLGSFNNLAKVREETLHLWGRAMKALPGSRLLLKDSKAADPAIRERISSALAQHGITGDRIEYVSWTADWKSHMALYDRLDIALDSIPLNSGTTAFDALWMGVPIVGIEGDWMGGRMTASILRALGKPEWVAQSEDEYVTMVTALARNPELRKNLRAGQRALMAASPLCNAGELTRALEAAFDSMFDRSCANGQAST